MVYYKGEGVFCLTAQSIDFGALLAQNGFSAPVSMVGNADGGGRAGEKSYIKTAEIAQAQALGAEVDKEKDTRPAGVNAEEATEKGMVQEFEQSLAQLAEGLEQQTVDAAIPVEKGEEQGADITGSGEQFTAENSPTPGFDNMINEMLFGGKKGQGADVDMNDVAMQNVGTQQQPQSKGAALA
jgi:hypothetical protein